MLAVNMIRGIITPWLTSNSLKGFLNPVRSYPRSNSIRASQCGCSLEGVITTWPLDLNNTNISSAFFCHCFKTASYFTKSCHPICAEIIPPFYVWVGIRHTMLVSAGVIGPTTHPIIERHNMAARHPAPISLNVNIISSQPEPWPVQGEDSMNICKQEFEQHNFSPSKQC